MLLLFFTNRVPVYIYKLVFPFFKTTGLVCRDNWYLCIQAPFSPFSFCCSVCGEAQRNQKDQVILGIGQLGRAMRGHFGSELKHIKMAVGCKPAYDRCLFGKTDIIDFRHHRFQEQASPPPAAWLQTKACSSCLSKKTSLDLCFSNGRNSFNFYQAENKRALILWNVSKSKAEHIRL